MRLGDMKFCSRGKHMVLRTGFNSNDGTTDGKQHWCRECQREYHRDRNLARKSAKEVAA